MNKTLLLILIPCVLAFTLSQANVGFGYPGYGGGAGVGYGSPFGGASPVYVNYAYQAAQASKTSRLLNLGKFRSFMNEAELYCDARVATYCYRRYNKFLEVNSYMQNDFI